MYCNSKR